MVIENKRLQELFDKWTAKTSTPSEIDELMLLLDSEDLTLSLLPTLKKVWEQQEITQTISANKKEEIVNNIISSFPNQKETGHSIVRNMFLSGKLLWAAASLLCILAAGAYGWLRIGKMSSPLMTVISKPVSHDVGPGRRGAILKLSDGQQIVLDSLGNGVVAVQNGTKVVLKNGRLGYDPTGKATGVIAYNTMSTPRGRQFRLTLPDGSKVWLNAASAITYPTAFIGNQREVSITGEVYFEVVHNSKKTFIVKAGNQEIKDIGTSFNVNAYNDEAVIQTTLLEGAVKLSTVYSSASVILKPGQQARVHASSSGDKGIHLVKDADLEKVMAWKNGLFNFDGADMETVMRQLSRWYDLEVVYEKGIPDIVFVGKMSKSISLSGVLKGLQGAGVHFRIEGGHRLVVFP